jgi:hypothetical protein
MTVVTAAVAGGFAGSPVDLDFERKSCYIHNSYEGASI